MKIRNRTLKDVLMEAHHSMHFIGVPRKGFNVHSRTSDGDTSLHIMAMRGDKYAVELLISSGAEIDAKGDMGCTPLYLAVMYNKTDVVESLLRHGSDPNLMSDFNKTPKERAIRDKNEELLHLFNAFDL